MGTASQRCHRGLRPARIVSGRTVTPIWPARTSTVERLTRSRSKKASRASRVFLFDLPCCTRRPGGWRAYTCRDAAAIEWRYCLFTLNCCISFCLTGVISEYLVPPPPHPPFRVVKCSKIHLVLQTAYCAYPNCHIQSSIYELKLSVMHDRDWNLSCQSDSGLPELLIGQTSLLLSLTDKWPTAGTHAVPHNKTGGSKGLHSKEARTHVYTHAKTKRHYSLSSLLLHSLLNLLFAVSGKGGKNRKRGKSQDEEKVKRDLIFKEYLQG